jgi:hypothetical protein
MARQPVEDQVPLITEASRSHSGTPHAVGLFWTSDQPVAETSTWQHATLTRDRYPCDRHPGGIRTRNTRRRTGVGNIFDSLSLNTLNITLNSAKNISVTLPLSAVNIGFPLDSDRSSFMSLWKHRQPALASSKCSVLYIAQTNFFNLSFFLL